MREVASRVETVPRAEPRKGTWRFYADAARHLFDPRPYAVAKYRRDAFRRRVEDLLESDRFDLVVCDFIFPAINLRHPLPCPAALFTHNVEAEIWRRHAETAANPLKALLYRMQHRRMLRYEGRTLERFDSVLTVSEIDAETFRRVYPALAERPLDVVPTGVDTSYFSPGPASDDRPRLVFTGSMDWLPNEDAMLFFCREVLPAVRAEVPEATLSIVGRAPTPSVSRLADLPSVSVTGRVEDVRPYLRDAAVYIVPLRIGGGTRLKIFEAMAMGKAVVTTSVGAEGLPVVDGEHVLIADRPEQFAAAVVELLRDRDRRRRIESSARALVVERYDWSAVAGHLESALAGAVRSRTAARPTAIEPATGGVAAGEVAGATPLPSQS
jgi:sugar transferase (PEP-CTERM/EpsH1 system associated)